MVLPSELLTVKYAEPIRVWLRHRFASVSLVFFEKLQFEDTQENVVLLLAHGSGGCDAFSLYGISDADDLAGLRPFDHFAVTPSEAGKWTDLLLTFPQRQNFRSITEQHFVPLADYGTLSLGTVTGANKFFALSESTRVEFGIPEDQVLRISPPGTRHLRGLRFSIDEWADLRDADQRVWRRSVRSHPGRAQTRPCLIHTAVTSRAEKRLRISLSTMREVSLRVVEEAAAP